MQVFDIESLDWSHPKIIETSRGTRQMRVASPTQEFWTAWRSAKESIKSKGINTNRSPDGIWTVTQWSDIPITLVAQIQASQAVSADIVIPKPANLSFDYFPFQKAGIAFAHTDATLSTLKRGTLIADDMGLGKTIQAIGIINCHPEIKKVLVVCPASLKINWKNELRRWLVRPMTIGIANSVDGVPNTDVVIINYDILEKLRQSLYDEWDNETDYDLVILDEAHVVRNTKTIRYKALKPLCDMANHVIALTGTPVWNKAQDLEALLRVLGEDFNTTWKDFGKFKYVASNSKRQAELNRRLRERVMVRRLKEAVMGELPPKLRQVIELPANGASGLLDAEVAAFIDRETLLNELRAALELSKVSDNQEEYLAALQALKDFARASFEEISRIRHLTALAKADHVIEHLRSIHDEDSTRKIVLFAHHRDVLEKISEAFGSKIIDGQTPPDKRQAIVDDFNANPSTWLVCGSIRAMGMGFTLTSSSWVVFAELDWVPAIMNQCEDRVHRIGQTADMITIQHIVLEKSLDARMAHTLVLKQAVMTGVTGTLEMEEPVIPALSTTIEFEPVTITRKEADAEALGLTLEMISKIHDGLRSLAMVCDGAVDKDNVGFNGCDSRIGKSLAAQQTLSPKQAALGKRLLKKYSRQLGEWVLELGQTATS